MEQDWIARQTAIVGERVAYFRQRTTGEDGRKLTAQGLADRCKDLGLPIGRPAIAKLESGIRQSVSAAEVQVLARALDVPPLLLLAPLGQQDTTEVLPGQFLDPLAAMAWFAGEARFGDPAPYAVLREESRPGPDNDDAEEFRTHRFLVDTLARSLQRGAPNDDFEYRGQLDTQARVIRHVRDEIRRRALTPPALPDGLEFIDMGGSYGPR